MYTEERGQDLPILMFQILMTTNQLEHEKM